MSEYFDKYLLYRIFGKLLAFEVFERHTQQKRGVSLHQVAQPLVVASGFEALQQFFIAQIDMAVWNRQPVFLWLLVAIYNMQTAY